MSVVKNLSYLDITKPKNLLKTSQFKLKKIESLKEQENRVWLYQSLPYKANDSYYVSGRYRVSRENCGTYLSKSYSCKDHPEVTLTHKKMSCGKLGCPVCYKTAGATKSKKIAGRLYGLKWCLEKEYGSYIGKPKHYSINFKLPKIIDDDHFKWWIKGVKDILIKEGLVGGVIIHHPVRIHESESCLYTSHHLHVLGFGKLINSDIFYKKYRVTYTNHGVRDDKSHTERTLNYNFSHSGLLFYKNWELKKLNRWEKDQIAQGKSISRHRHLVTRSKSSYHYFGLLDPKCCKSEILSSIEIESKCPVCNQPLYEIIDGLDLKFILNPIAERKIKFLKDMDRTINYHTYFKTGRKIENSIVFYEFKKVPVTTSRFKDDIQKLSSFKIVDERQMSYIKDKLKWSNDPLMEIEVTYQVTLRPLGKKFFKKFLT